jgi:hypothetical protein
MGYFGSTRKNTGELLHTDLVLNAVFSFFTDVTRATMKITPNLSWISYVFSSIQGPTMSYNDEYVVYHP